MAETMAPDFVTPPSGVRQLPVTSIVPTGRPLDEGIKLFLNGDGHGFLLEKESEGLWLSPVENTVTASSRGGGTLRNRRWSDGSSFLVLSLHSPNPEHMYDMMARLVDVVTNQGDFFDLVVFDPYSQETRRRTLLYEDGLENLNEVSGTYHTVGVTAKFLSPFWRGPERVVVERIAPPVKPLITADPGSPVNRWDDPEFGDSTAYEPWFVVDGGLEKQGTGDDHGTFVSNHRIEVSPGETVSVSADVSYVDGPNVGDIQVMVRAYDSGSALVAGSTTTVISESYGGTYMGTYVVPDTGVEIELGFYTGPGVHANTRVRIEGLDVKREVQYLARYEWEGEPHASPSIKRDHTGQIVARNEVIPLSETFHATPIVSTIKYLGDEVLVTATDDTASRTNPRIQRVDTSHALIPVQPGDAYALRAEVNHDRDLPMNLNAWLVDASYNLVQQQTGTNGVGEWTEIGVTGVVPDGAAYLGWQIRVNSSTAAGSTLAGDTFRVRKVRGATGSSEQAALDQVAEYFDGDFPDVMDEGSREGAYSFPFFPVFLADSTVQGEHEVRVEGDAPVWPVWEITGPGRDVEIIGPDGSRLFVEGEVTSPIRIITEPGKRSISDDTGLIWERMKPGDDQFFALQPGEQIIKMTMVGGNPESTIKAIYSENWKTPRGTAQGMIRGGGIDE